MGVYLSAISKFCMTADLDVKGIDSDRARKMGNGGKVGIIVLRLATLNTGEEANLWERQRQSWSVKDAMVEHLQGVFFL